jgi:hypothetical protein
MTHSLQSFIPDELSNAADASSAQPFITDDSCEPWFCYDFRPFSVSAFAYILHSGPFLCNSAHPKYWVVEGSSDGSTWITFDTQSDNDDLNGPHRTKTFPLAARTHFSWIRIRQTGENHCGNFVFTFSYFDILASLIGSTYDIDSSRGN